MTPVVFGRLGASHPRIGAAGERITRSVATRYFSRRRFFTRDSAAGRAIGAELRRRMEARQPVLLLGIGPAGHNSGAALVEVGSDGALRILANEEEERYTGVKHCNAYPYSSIEVIRERLTAIGVGPDDLLAAFATWDYVELATLMLRCTFEEFPGPILTEPSEDLNFAHLFTAAEAPKRLAEQLGLPQPVPVIGIRHHDGHASSSWALSPWAHSEEPTMVAVFDGFGDDASISLYLGDGGPPELLQRNDSPFDSLGVLYGVLSSTLGGWPPFSSEGRYMGAAAWGCKDRLTNPYYGRLREILHLGPGGELRLNRVLANWPRRGMDHPYSRELIDLLGEPIALADMWNPDAVLSVDDIEHASLTKERVDKAAALQLVFEDGLFHVIGHLIRETGARRLVLTGGTALNCTANAELPKHFDDEYYERYVGRGGRGGLRIWVPPTPGDAGVPFGAPMEFALRNGAVPGAPLDHAFLCGTSPSRDAIDCALDEAEGVESVCLGTVSDPTVARLIGSLIAEDGVVGMFQGAAETGPRALGHRSILANACNPRTLEVINSRVKFRERIRPLAPMATLAAAIELFELDDGASDGDYNAYNWMVLAARARPAAYEHVPAVVHRDGTGRIQVVREETDPLCYAILRELGDLLGVELCVNTSLNVGTPIVQTPRQALVALRRAGGMDGLLLVASDGTATWAWDSESRPAAAAERLTRAQAVTA